MPATVFKLFVSSPGDVAAERARAERVVEKLNGEFSDRARFQPVFWEDHFYSADRTFQDQIPEAADCDLVVAIFRGRLGSPLPQTFKRQPDGEPYPSGTAYEILSAIAKRRGGATLPDIYVFSHPHDPVVSLDDPKKPEIERQWRALKGFFERWFKASSGEYIRGSQTYESSDDFAERIERCLRQWLAGRGIVARTIWDRARFGSPFPGLAAFGPDREHIFFGRDLAVRQAAERLRQAETPFLLILGASGAGKSSLLRAGLLPKLILPGAIPGIDLFRPVVLSPDLDPFAELAAALLVKTALGAELAGGRFADPAALAAPLRGDPVTAAGVIGGALDKAAEARRAAAHFDAPRPERLLIAIDQAERLFTEAAEHADAFGRLLKALAGAAAYVVLTMRSDAYARFQACAPLLALRASGATFDLMPPTSAELEDIVTRPIAACEPPLAERLVADAKGGDALPLMQMTLQRLFEAQEARGDGVLSADDYRGMAAAVTEVASAAMSGLGARGLKALEALVAGLVADIAPDSITGDPAPVVVALDRDALVQGRPDRAALVDAFVSARLLTVDGGGRLRPTHDALLRIWPKAAALVKEMGPLIRARHSLSPLARAWFEEKQPEDRARHLEISTPLLAAGRQLEARFGDDLGEPLRPFIAEAAKAEAAERARRTFRGRVTIAASLAAAITMAGLAAWAFSQRNEALAQRAIAETNEQDANSQKAAAQRSLSVATDAANSLVFDFAQQFRDMTGVPASLIRSLLDRAVDLQEKLLSGGQSSNDLLRSPAAALGEISETRLTLGDSKGALSAAERSAEVLEKLLTQQPGDVSWQADLMVALAKIGEAQVARGEFSAALKAYQDSLAVADRLAKSGANNAGWQLNLSALREKIGEAKAAQGDFSGALEAYHDGLAIAEPSAKSDPTNTGWQLALSVLYEKTGEAKEALGDISGALKLYQNAEAIADPLVKSNPRNARWQRADSLATIKVGDLSMALGDVTGGLEAYQRSFEITARLAQSDPGNVGLQRELLIASSKIGDAKMAQRDFIGALGVYQDNLAIAERVAKSDPGNAGWQYDLSVSHEKVGEAQAAQRDFGGAVKSYEESLEIKLHLIDSTLVNAGWRHDLLLLYEKIGAVKMSQSDFSGALNAYQNGLAIAKSLAKSNPDNAGWQHDLSELHKDFGLAEAAQGHLAGALEDCAESAAILERLTKSDTSNLGWQHDLAISYSVLVRVYLASKDSAKARDALSAGRTIMVRLVALSPDNAIWKNDLTWFDVQIAALTP